MSLILINTFLLLENLQESQRPVNDSSRVKKRPLCNLYIA